jgi:xanthine/CO dehydrogenase XdhC/CoxF family maturation factor
LNQWGGTGNGGGAGSDSGRDFRWAEGGLGDAGGNRGSLPTGRDARMLVREDGVSVGTVGGGRLEADAQRVAGEVARARQPQLIHFSPTAQNALDHGVLCGGEVSLFVEPVLPGPDAQVFGEMLRMLRERIPGLEAVRLSGGGSVRRLVKGVAGPAVGTLRSAALDQRVSERLIV